MKTLFTDFASLVSPAERFGELEILENACFLVEDGFIRSVGLGADLTRPASWVLDAVGMYYDATAPSGLEQLLAEFDIERLANSSALLSPCFKPCSVCVFFSNAVCAFCSASFKVRLTCLHSISFSIQF